MKIKLKFKKWFGIIIIFFLCKCQINLEKPIQENSMISSQETENMMNLLRNKIHELSFFYTENAVDRNFVNLSTIQASNGNFNPEIDTMITPYLPPNGDNDKDEYFKNMFFNILEMIETLRYLLENYNKFIIRSNIGIITHPGQTHLSINFPKMIKFSRAVREEIIFVKNSIKKYNSQIDEHFTGISYHSKMSGYYSSDNSHFNYNQHEFSIEDIDNFSYSYFNGLAARNILKTKNAKLKISRPLGGKRAGTVFISPGKPNILRGALGSDFGAYNLGAVVGMTIEYAITGEIYYYKDALQ